MSYTCSVSSLPFVVFYIYIYISFLYSISCCFTVWRICHKMFVISYVNCDWDIWQSLEYIEGLWNVTRLPLFQTKPCKYLQKWPTVVRAAYHIRVKCDYTTACTQARVHPHLTPVLRFFKVYNSKSAPFHKLPSPCKITVTSSLCALKPSPNPILQVRTTVPASPAQLRWIPHIPHSQYPQKSNMSEIGRASCRERV